MNQRFLKPFRFSPDASDLGWLYSHNGQFNYYARPSSPDTSVSSTAPPSPLPHLPRRKNGHGAYGVTAPRATAANHKTPKAAHLPGSSEPVNSDPMVKECQDIIALYNASIAVSSTLSMQEVTWRLYKESSRLIDTSNFAIAIYDDQMDTLNFRLIFNEGERLKPLSLKHATNPGLTSRVLSMQGPLLVQDVLETHDVVEISQLCPDKVIRSWLGVPILNPVLAQEGIQGVIIIWSDKPNAFTDRDLWLLSAIGTQAALAIRNAYLFEASQRRALEMAVINDVAQMLSSSLNLNDVLTRIMEQVEGMLNAETGFLLLTDPLTGDLVFQTALGEQAHKIKPFRLPKGRGIAGQVALTRQPVRLSRVDGEIDFQARNILCVPLVWQEQVIGVLVVINKREGDFTRQDLELLSALASFAAIAIQNARLYVTVQAERNRVLEIEEQTRKALARDLHDGPVQMVAGIVMRLGFCQNVLEKRPALLGQEISQVQTLAERVLHQMRTLLFELRPLVLETEGLEAAVQVFLDHWQVDLINKQPTRLKLEIRSPQPDGHLSRQDSKVETAIFAIIQEAVNNAIKHAQANHIVVQLKETANGFYTTIADDGRGFQLDQVLKNYKQQGSLGMVNMRERIELINGKFAIKSVPGQGTQIKLYVPKSQEKPLKNGLNQSALALA